MDLDEYQQYALRTAPRGEGAYGLPDDLTRIVEAGEYCLDTLPGSTIPGIYRKLDQMVWSLGLAGEAGEFADLMKKVHGHGHPLDVQKASKELGDVLWYAAVLAHSLGLKLSQVAELNVEKLRARYPDGFTIEKSLKRKEGDV